MKKTNILRESLTSLLRFAMRKLVGSFALVAIISFASASFVLAKEGPPRLTISGPGLKGVVEVTNRELLDGLNDWELLYRQLGAIAEPKIGAGYEVTAFADEDGKFIPFNRWRYHLNPSGAVGYIFYSGAAEFGHVSNDDGKWFCAAPGADASMRRLLRSLGVSAAEQSATSADKITIKGPGIEGEVELKSRELDPEQLIYFGWGRMAVPKVGDGYELTRYSQNCTGQYAASLRLRYYPGSQGKPGYLFRAESADNNVYSMADNWFFTAPQADEFMRSLLKKMRVTTQAMQPAASAVTLGPLPEKIIAGQAVTVSFTVHQSESEPRLPDTLIVYSQLVGEESSRTVYPAKADGVYGHYKVTLEFARAGTWYWLINAERPHGEQPMPILNVLGTDGKPVGAQSAPASGNVNANEVSPLLLALVLIGLLGIVGAVFAWMGARTRTQ